MIEHYRPSRLQQGISEQCVGAETLLYDASRHQAFCLNGSSAAIWRMCDGTRTVAELAAAATLELRVPITQDVVRFALAEMRSDGLLQAEASGFVLPQVSRRALVRGLGAGAMLLLPAIAVVAPGPAAAQYSGCLDCDVKGTTGAKAATSVVDSRKDDYKKLQKAKESQAANTDPFRLKSLR